MAANVTVPYLYVLVVSIYLKVPMAMGWPRQAAQSATVPFK